MIVLITTLTPTRTLQEFLGGCPQFSLSVLSFHFFPHCISLSADSCHFLFHLLSFHPTACLFPWCDLREEEEYEEEEEEQPVTEPNTEDEGEEETSRQVKDRYWDSASSMHLFSLWH